MSPRLPPACLGLLALAGTLTLPGPLRAQDEPECQPEVPLITFEAEDFGANSGVERVELWVTRDAGATWSLALTAKDQEEGTFDYQAPQEGLYGFYTRSIDRAGNQQPQPSAGTQPELVIVVDRTAPKVTILRPTEGAELTSGQRAVVYWEAQDANFGPSPVSVSFRSSPEADWEDLPDGPFEASGRSVLALPGGEHPAAEILVEAVDRAGNAGKAIHKFAIRRAPSAPVPALPGVSREEAVRQAYDFCNRGRTFYKLRQYERSEEAYTKALELVPDLAVAHHDLGVVNHIRQRYDKSLQHFRAALESDPNNPEFRYSLAVAYFRLERNQDAMDHLGQALAQESSYDLKSEILWTMAMIHEREGRGEEARAAWRRIVEMRDNVRMADARKKLGVTEER